MGKRIINKQNQPTYIEYWITNNPNLSIDECEQLRSTYVKENNYQCIEYYRKRYPDKTEEELVELRKKFIDSRKYIKENNSTTLEYYTSRGYSVDDARVMLANRQRTFSLEKCIEKYGEVEGYNIFNKRQQKWVKSLQNNFAKHGESRSSKSQIELQFVTEICNTLNISVPNKQKYINDTDGCYAYDFTYNHKIIEFNGDYWHCHRQIYNKDFINKTINKYAWEIWEKDERKINVAKKHGYDVLVVWESEYLVNKDYVIEKCIKFLNQ